jgi:hydrogenase expression/formation protein HypE
MSMGKLSDNELKELLACIKKDLRVIVPPMTGYDSGVHKIGNKYIVISTDPCTGVPEEWFGYLLINYAASDVALFGAKPEFCTINLLGPPETKSETFQIAMQQACNAANELDIAIVTGHTGTYSSLCSLVGVCTAYGTVEPENLKTPGNAKAGDAIVCTKPIGMETAVNFSLTHKALALKLFGGQQAEQVVKQVHLQSCVNEALQLAKSRGLHAMHDATEGGLVAALNELADASKLGFKIDYEKVPLTSEVQVLRETFGLSDEQVLAMSSTGTILAAVSPGAEKEVAETLKKCGLQASFLGQFTKDKKCVLVRNNRKLSFPKVADDPYSRIMRA